MNYDGYRIQLHVNGPTITTFTRNGHHWTAKFQPIAKAARGIPTKQAIINGEICVQDEKGVTDFSIARNWHTCAVRNVQRCAKIHEILCEHLGAAL